MVTQLALSIVSIFLHLAVPCPLHNVIVTSERTAMVTVVENCCIKDTMVQGGQCPNGFSCVVSARPEGNKLILPLFQVGRTYFSQAAH